jgi:hypothetical protein
MNKEINQHKYDGFPDDNKDSHLQREQWGGFMAAMAFLSACVLAVIILTAVATVKILSDKDAKLSSHGDNKVYETFVQNFYNTFPEAYKSRALYSFLSDDDEKAVPYSVHFFVPALFFGSGYAESLSPPHDLQRMRKGVLKDGELTIKIMMQRLDQLSKLLADDRSYCYEYDVLLPQTESFPVVGEVLVRKVKVTFNIGC